MGFSSTRFGSRKKAKTKKNMGNYKQALEIKRTLKQKAGEALVLGNIARVQASLGKPNDAYKSYNEAEKLQRAIGDKKGLGVTLINLGQLYTERSKYDDALKAFKESLQIHRDIGDEYRQALCLNNIGNVYLAKGQSSDALTYYEGALELRRKGNVPSEIGETLHNLGEASLKAGDYGKSLDYHLKALELFRNSGDKSGGAIQSYSMYLPSGDQRDPNIPFAPGRMEISRVCICTSLIAAFSPVGGSLVPKASVFPSGDHVGSVSGWSPFVSLSGGVPSLEVR